MRWISAISTPASTACSPATILAPPCRMARPRPHSPPAIAAYFAGDLAALDSLPVAGIGSDFQRRVWAALRTIPAGTTQSYGQLAAAIGQPAASRAVGLANGANPIGIVVPCHRVIGTSGALTGYAGGVERKAWLLIHEGAIRPEIRLQF